jgi:hypothetical protein
MKPELSIFENENQLRAGELSRLKYESRILRLIWAAGLPLGHSRCKRKSPVEIKTFPN